MKTSQVFITSLLNEAVGITLIIAVWGIASFFYPAYVIPSPLTVIFQSSDFLTGDLLHHLSVTFLRVIAGFLLAFGFGTLLGCLAAMTRWHQPMNSLMIALQVVPGTILGVVFLLMFGIGSATPILLVAVLTLPTLAINTANGLMKRNVQQEEYLRTIKASRGDLIRYSYLPALIPVTRSNLSLGMSMAVKVVVLGEFIGSQDGLGYLLNHARIIFNMREVFFYLLILMAFTLLFQAAQSVFFSLALRKYFYPE